MNAIRSRISELVTVSSSGGTLLTSGLAWGWRTLSPQWAPFWRTNGTILPQDKLDSGVIVFLSDGENDWTQHTSGHGLDINGLGRPEERRLGFGPNQSAIEIASATLGTTVNDPSLAAKIAADRADPSKRKVDKAIEQEHRTPELDSEKFWDTRFSQLCAKIKESKITIYTIAFGTNNGGANLLRDCASTKDHYFRSPSRADLDKAFKTIADGLTSITTVRVVR